MSHRKKKSLSGVPDLDEGTGASSSSTPTRSSTRRKAASLANGDVRSLEGTEGPAAGARVSNGKSDNASPAAKSKERNSAALGADHGGDKKSKWQTVITRSIYGWAMIFVFCGIVSAGHVAMILTIMGLQIAVYKEVIDLFARPVKERKLRWGKALNWYFFAVAQYFLYGETLLSYFKNIIILDSAAFAPLAQKHRFISFLLYLVGFVGFVSTLKKGHYKFQFSGFGWTHMTLLMVVFSSHFVIRLMLEGFVWFFVPSSLVICNDVFAYVCGMLFGRHQLIALSPKKTVEGFLGAFVCTLIFSWGWAWLCMQPDYLVCPARDLGSNAWSGLTCERNPSFIPREIFLPGLLRDAASYVLRRPILTFELIPFRDIHAPVFALFASFIAPFGGFFASGFKRAFNIKDFGSIIPGHGGVSDRFDCQFLMGLFSYVYFQSFVKINRNTPASILATIVSALSAEQQMELAHEFGRFLSQRYPLNTSLAECLREASGEIKVHIGQ